MTAILRHDLGDKLRFPDRLEVMGRRRPGEAVVFGDHENRLAILVEPNVMGVHRADDVDPSRHETGVVKLICALIAFQHRGHLNQRGLGGEKDALAVHRDAHGVLEEAFIDQKPTFGVAPDQVELAGLVRRQRQRRVVLGKPGNEARRHGIGDGLRGGDFLAVRASRLRRGRRRLSFRRHCFWRLSLVLLRGGFLRRLARHARSPLNSDVQRGSEAA